MPLFDFTPIVSKKKETIRKDNYTNGKYSVAVKNVEGVVCINLEANYYVQIEEDKYDIIAENYDTKGFAEVYPQRLDNNGQRILLIRSLLINKPIVKQYLPFAPGICVSGDIVVNNYTTKYMFNIKKVMHDYRDNDCKAALQFYQDNYETIQNAIKAKWMD